MNEFNYMTDFTSDFIEKVSSPASRAGSTIERAGKMLEAGIDPDVIALQMTKNSPNSIQYTKADVNAFGNLYRDTKSKVVITAKQSRSLIKDQYENPSDDFEFQF